MLHAIQKKAKADHLPGFEPARRAPAASESVTVKRLKTLSDEKRIRATALAGGPEIKKLKGKKPQLEAGELGLAFGLAQTQQPADPYRTTRTRNTRRRARSGCGDYDGD